MMLKLRSLCLLLCLFCCCVFVSAQETASKKEGVVFPHHPIELSFNGPATSESAETNPFTEFRLLVKFEHAQTGTQRTIRGFYSADGNSAHTGSDSGNVWQVRFAADKPGRWTYSAQLRTGDNIAIDLNPESGEPIELEKPNGELTVTNKPEQNLDPLDFRDRGRIIVDNGYFRFDGNGPRWLKGGADSPENLLAFVDFDGTYRTSEKARKGESDPGAGLHKYPTHAADWRDGDPTWQDGKGKALIGAVNYLASTGMNAVYFLTLNIGGDGKDVWPYRSHEDFTRFDCSKLDQWEIVFDHMQRRGILLHVVTQETENEKLLDDGDTGSLRKLYYHELIARFAHHPALVWNLGEENGPAHFTPNGQNASQQKAMATFFESADPYQHPVVIHTHATQKDKKELLPSLLGHSALDGLSFQVDNPKRVHQELIQWKEAAAAAGHPWLIAMDEIGKWDTGVAPDSVDPGHDTIRHQVLWGSLMGGGAGVEWYFGAHQPHNDLNCEDWRQRENMWKQTKIALDFFENNLPYWEMKPSNDLTLATDDYCFADPGQVYAIYLPPQNMTGEADAQANKPLNLKLAGSSEAASYDVRWLDPKNGGEFQVGSVSKIEIATTTESAVEKSLGHPPAADGEAKAKDWVILVSRNQ